MQLPDFRNHANIQFALAFPKLVADQGGWDVAASYLDYVTLPNMPSGNPHRLDRQRAILADLAKEEQQVLSKLSTIRYAMANQDEFDMASVPDGLAAVENKLLGIQKDINTTAAACYDADAKCDYRAQADILAIKLPMRKQAVTILGKCSGRSVRFISINGGCKDLDTGNTWSAISTASLNQVEAQQYCTDRVESGVSGWILPTSAELIALAGPDGAKEGLIGQFDDWFWSSDRSLVNVELGSTRDANAKLKLRVVCKRASN